MWRCFALLLLSALSGFAGNAPWHVSVTPEELRFAWPAPRTGQIDIREIPLHTAADPARDGASLWSGDASAGAAAVARFDGVRDRLFAKFELREHVTGQRLGPAQCVTDFAALPRRTQSLGAARSPKGISCLVDLADAVALGITQSDVNIDIAGLLDWQSTNPQMSFDYEGRHLGLRAGSVAALDHTLRSMHGAGFRVTGILLNYPRADTLKSSPLIHPLTAASPGGVVAAFNTNTAEGAFLFRAVVHWLVDRYTRADAQFGLLAGLIIGNEVQSHGSWYHLGQAVPEVLVREYASALRIADLATRSVHADFPLYVSLEHHWTLSASRNPQEGMSGVQLLEGLNRILQSEGNLPWRLAFHPYPENLGDPRFWLDKTAPVQLDAPRVTFHNLEVLPAFLAQARFLYDGQPRRIALTEQGFHCPPGGDGEVWQAAAYALAWKKVCALPTIEAFDYHRHVDHPSEGGLRCGLHEHDGSFNPSGMGRARRIWEVVRQAGTPQEDVAFAFALPVVGRSNWQRVVTPPADVK